VVVVEVSGDASRGEIFVDPTILEPLPKVYEILEDVISGVLRGEPIVGKYRDGVVAEYERDIPGSRPRPIQAISIYLNLLGV
jgi:hypothetical protein